MSVGKERKSNQERSNKENNSLLIADQVFALGNVLCAFQALSH